MTSFSSSSKRVKQTAPTVTNSAVMLASCNYLGLISGFLDIKDMVSLSSISTSHFEWVSTDTAIKSMKFMLETYFKYDDWNKLFNKMNNNNNNSKSINTLRTLKRLFSNYEFVLNLFQVDKTQNKKSKSLSGKTKYDFSKLHNKVKLKYILYFFKFSLNKCKLNTLEYHDYEELSPRIVLPDEYRIELPNCEILFGGKYFCHERDIELLSKDKYWHFEDTPCFNVTKTLLAISTFCERYRKDQDTETKDNLLNYLGFFDKNVDLLFEFKPTTDPNDIYFALLELFFNDIFFENKLNLIKMKNRDLDKFISDYHLKMFTKIKNKFNYTSSKMSQKWSNYHLLRKHKLNSESITPLLQTLCQKLKLRF